jgi:hypothetical protein
VNRPITLIGALLVVLGLLLMSGASGLTTISYPEVGLTSIDGDVDSPDQFSAGNIVPLSLRIEAADSRDGGFSTYQAWTVAAAFFPDKGPAVNEVADLHFVKTLTVGGTTLHSAVALFEGSWTVPLNATGALYRVEWSVKNGNDLLADKTVYLNVSEDLPDGSFLVNGRAANSNSDISLTDGTMTFEFVPSKFADSIASVYMEIWHEGAKVDTVELEKTAGRWTAGYELPDAGFYGLDGYIVTHSGVSMSKLSALAELDDGSDYVPEDPYTGEGSGAAYEADYGMIGLALILGGALAVVIGLRKQG